MENQRKNKKGITLIALVITIIVLLILAGVTLSLVAGENGILKRATSAVDTNRREAAKEQVSLEIATYQTEYYEEKYVNKKVNENQNIGDWIYENHAGENKTDDYEFTIEPSGEEGIYKVTIEKNKNLETIVTGTLTSSGKLTWDENVEPEEEWKIEANLVDYWDLSSSLENNTDSSTSSLEIYKGTDLKFENNSAHLESTALRTKTNYRFPDEFTLLLEYCPTSFKAWSSIVCQMSGYTNDTTTAGLAFHRSDTQLGLFNGLLGVTRFENEGFLKIGSYTKIAITYDGSVLSLYGDSMLVHQEQSFKNVNSPLYIGGGQYCGTTTAGAPWQFANGYYKNLKIYDGALSQEDIRHIQ